jgi:excisionase family DNA binding protein
MLGKDLIPARKYKRSCERQNTRMNENTTIQLNVTIQMRPEQLTPILDLIAQRLSEVVLTGSTSVRKQDACSAVSKEKLAFSVNEAAELLGICPQTVYRLISRGLLKSSDALRTKLIPRAELENFLKKSVSK